jgi:hypothetical protein
MPRIQHPLKLLWPQIIPELEDLIKDAPRSLTFSADRLAWAKAELEAIEQACLTSLQGTLDTGAELRAEFGGGHLRLLADNSPVIQGVYLDKPEGQLTQSYWNYLILSRANDSADNFAAKLSHMPNAPETPAARQFEALVSELFDLKEQIETAERVLNNQLYSLYALTPDEKILVQKATRSRKGATNQG